MCILLTLLRQLKDNSDANLMDESLNDIALLKVQRAIRVIIRTFELSQILLSLKNETDSRYISRRVELSGL